MIGTDVCRSRKYCVKRPTLGERPGCLIIAQSGRALRLGRRGLQVRVLLIRPAGDEKAHA